MKSFKSVVMEDKEFVNNVTIPTIDSELDRADKICTEQLTIAQCNMIALESSINIAKLDNSSIVSEGLGDLAKAAFNKLKEIIMKIINSLWELIKKAINYIKGLLAKCASKLAKMVTENYNAFDEAFSFVTESGTNSDIRAFWSKSESYLNDVPYVLAEPRKFPWLTKITGSKDDLVGKIADFINDASREFDKLSIYGKQYDYGELLEKKKDWIKQIKNDIPGDEIWDLRYGKLNNIFPHYEDALKWVNDKSFDNLDYIYKVMDKEGKKMIDDLRQYDSVENEKEIRRQRMKTTLLSMGVSAAKAQVGLIARIRTKMAIFATKAILTVYREMNGAKPVAQKVEYV